jgi:hypothetical protein
VLGGSHFLELAICIYWWVRVGYMFTYNKKKREIKSVLYNEIYTPKREEDAD